ncbi:MAG: ABC transporter substrate-binding protein [Coprococcus sp.]
MKKMKKFFAAVLVGLMTVSVLAGCGGSGTTTDTKAAGETEAAGGETEASGDDAMAALKAVADVGYDGEPVNLTFWGLSTRQEGLEAMTAVFNEANPNINVTVSYYDTDGIKDACKTAAQSGSMPSMWFNWGGALGQYYVDNGVTYDLTQYAADNGWADTFNEGALSLCTLGGQICGYPTSYNVIGMYYRTDIFEQYNIEIPTTMDEFTQVCATLKENGITPISTAGLNGWHVMRLVEQYIEYEAGTELHDQLQALETSWDCEAVVNALTTYQEYCQNGYYPDGFVTASPDDTMMAFGMGTAAMDIQGQWYDGTLNNNGVSLDNVSWFPFPNGTGRMSAFAEMVQFNGKLTDDELKAAMLYTQFMNTPEAAAAYPNCFNLPLPTADAEMPDASIQPNVGPMIEYSAEGGTFTITDQAFPSEVADVLFSCQDAIAGGTMQPAEAAKKIQEAIEAYKAK